MTAARYTETHRQLPGPAQIALGRGDAREHATTLGHALGTWRPAGTVADDEAICEDCGRAAFVTFGMSIVRPLAGVRFFGSALHQRCSGLRGRNQQAVR